MRCYDSLAWEKCFFKAGFQEPDGAAKEERLGCYRSAESTYTMNLLISSVSERRTKSTGEKWLGRKQLAAEHPRTHAS